MSSARGWFTKRANPPGSKSPHSISADKLPLHVDSNKSSASFKFNTFAAVMGKKTKKPSLAFQDPSSPSTPTNDSVSGRPNSSRYTNRPPTESISSTVCSGDDSNEPITPRDVPQDRKSFPRSVFTLSDSDPFAAGAISVVTHEVADSNRVSVFSSSSANDSFSKKDESVHPFRRTSFASTSSQSHSNPLVAQLAKPPAAFDAQKNIMGQVLHFHRFVPSAVDGTVFQGPLCPSAVPSRPKGYTESVSARITPSISRLPHKSPTSPNGELSPISPFPQSTAPSLSSKVSASRLVMQPPTTPPVHDLPAPPVSVTASDKNEGLSLAVSGSTSSISFTSSPSTKDYDDDRCSSLQCRPPKCPTKAPLLNSLADIFGQRPTSSVRAPTASSGHALKKSMSHSTLQKSKVGNELSPPSPSTTKPETVEKELKKQQHSFHPSRLQTPSVSQLSQSNSGVICNTSSSDTDLPTEPWRLVTNSPSMTMRRRLFSGSSHRNPSTGTADDDLHSVFSLPAEAERAHEVASLRPGLLRDQGDSESVLTCAIAPAPDYAQQIMSPAEMLKVEAVVQSEFDSKYGELLRNRQRNISFASASTPPPGAMHVNKEGLSPAPTLFPRFLSRTPSDSSGTLSLLARRPPTAQDAFYSSPLSTSPVSPTVGLPPPPRSRSRPQTSETTYSDVSNRRSDSLLINPLFPPPRKRLTPVAVNGDKSPHKSIMRKPSFLEITDEAPSYNGSFLDLDSGKESLDLPRDDDIGLDAMAL
ncbi:hypothetical protein PAXRUDRAFT_7759 [Paxillus rubicundulus Ve08.2h10]|uniref:Uncharacterized protein n=1 Tax=Paxillus rubicundulus Ve08.2h10 TaxID=930991 RepID=A0A0D0E727_9AGAM|nr:hypothetical protein PAXRUDRAFT_7759 [Paxillus rubicundulus Ve08.2h10]